MSGQSDSRLALGDNALTGRETTGPEHTATWQWLLPALAYALGVGLVGIATKLTLRDMAWQDMFVWLSCGYTVTALILVAFYGVRLKRSRGHGFAAISGLCAAAGLVFLSLALQDADAGKVVPITAAYPVLTAIIATVALRERMTPQRILGTLLVVIGIVLIGME